MLGVRDEGIKETYEILLHNPLREKRANYYIFNDSDSAENFYFKVFRRLINLNLLPGRKDSGIHINNIHALEILTKKLNSSNIVFEEFENIVEELKDLDIYYGKFKLQYYSVLRFFNNKKNTKLNKNVRYLNLVLNIILEREAIF